MKQKENITEKMREFKVPLLIGLIFVVWIASWSWKKWQYQKTLEVLNSVSPEQVTMLKVYPKVDFPTDTFVEFTPPDAIITDFFHALTDHRPYSSIHDSVFGNDQSWFFEVVAGEVFIQIGFHIPYDTGNIVAGMLGKFTKNSERYYGYFQSRQLYQWYQKYSHRWLTPEEAPEPLP